MSDFILLGILTFSVIGVGAIALFFKNYIERFRYPITIISSAMVCGLIFIHIFPELFEIGGHKIGLAVLAGLFLQMILENLTSGFEHGHLHHHDHGKQSKGMVIGLLVGLCLHAFIEGTPLLINLNGTQSEVVATNIHLHDDHEDHDHDHETHALTTDVHDQDEETAHVHGESCNHNETVSSPIVIEKTKLSDTKNASLITKYFWAIINHNIPITIVLSLLFLTFGYTFKKSILLLSIFGISGPIGALFGLWLLTIDGFMFYSTYLMAIATGMLLHIITHILTEHAHNRKKMSILQQVGSLTIGIALVILIFGM